MFVGTPEEFSQAVNKWRQRRSTEGQECLCRPTKYVRPDGNVELHVGDMEMQGCPLHCKHLGYTSGWCQCGHRVA